MDRIPSERRVEESTDFILEILDSRHEIMNTLRENFTNSEVVTQGYVANFTPPRELSPFLNTSESSDTIINTTVMRSSAEARELGYVCIELVPLDHLPLKLTADHGLIMIEQGEHVGIISQELFRGTLESIFTGKAEPDQIASLSDGELLDMILTLSPDTKRDYHFNLEEVDRKIDIHFVEEEVEKDTVDSLTVELLRPHPCGADVGTLFSVRESLLERSSHLDARKTTNISEVLAQFSPDVDEGLTVEAVLIDGDKNKTIPLKALTHYHMADVHDALHALRQAS